MEEEGREKNCIQNRYNKEKQRLPIFFSFLLQVENKVGFCKQNMNTFCVI